MSGPRTLDLEERCGVCYSDAIRCECEVAADEEAEERAAAQDELEG